MFYYNILMLCYYSKAKPKGICIGNRMDLRAIKEELYE